MALESIGCGLRLCDVTVRILGASIAGPETYP